MLKPVERDNGVHHHHVKGVRVHWGAAVEWMHLQRAKQCLAPGQTAPKIVLPRQQAGLPKPVAQCLRCRCRLPLVQQALQFMHFSGDGAAQQDQVSAKPLNPRACTSAVNENWKPARFKMGSKGPPRRSKNLHGKESRIRRA